MTYLCGSMITTGEKNFYRPQRSWGKEMFLQASVILLTGGVCLSVCWDITPTGADTSPRADTSLVQSILGDTVNARAVRILLKCTLVMIALFTLNSRGSTFK